LLTPTNTFLTPFFDLINYFSGENASSKARRQSHRLSPGLWGWLKAVPLAAHKDQIKDQKKKNQRRCVQSLRSFFKPVCESIALAIVSRPECAAWQHKR